MARHASSSSRSAPRLSQPNSDRSGLIVAGLAALALLGLGEAAPGAFPVQVVIEGHGRDLAVTVDGQTHGLSSLVGPPWRGIALQQPAPVEREYQVDGSDTTSNGDRQPALIASLMQTPLYGFDAWLRDESSYSRWDRTVLTDLATGDHLVRDAALPTDFRIEAALRRPEAPARLWLLGPTTEVREGLELDRDRRNARWLVDTGGRREPLPRWFFPEQPAPFAAEIVQLVGRSSAAAFGLTLAALAMGAVVRRAGHLPRPNSSTITQVWAALGGRLKTMKTAWLADGLRDALLAGWLLAAALVSARLYHQLPHILDAVSYTFQAGLFASGRLGLDAQPPLDALKGPFEVVWRGRLFSQYPPGAAAAYAVGQLAGVEWLVGPLVCLGLIAATSWTGGALYGRACGLVVLALGVVSPFILFQAGSFLSHPVVGGLLAFALASFVRAEQHGGGRWYAACGALLGLAFVAREAASMLFAVPLAVRLVQTRRWTPASIVVVCGVPFLLLYLLYNATQTGNPIVLPRSLFDPSDRFGFGDGIGFHTRHTLAAGLANTDELLTMLQFDLFGWPPLFTLGLLGLPFLLGRARSWDYLAAGGVLAFVLAYVGYFYHGIALGPRYYFEAVPWMLLLGGRGAQVLAGVARSRAAVAVILSVLSLNTVLLYLPLEGARRADMSGFPDARKLKLAFVQVGLGGPQLIGMPSRALVVTADWWLYNASLAPLNCARLPDCDVVFALATNPADEQRLTARFAGRAVLHTRFSGDQVDLVPAGTS